jgi:hypothetical protein
MLQKTKELKWPFFTLLVAATSFLPSLHTTAQSNGLGITPKLSYTIQAGNQRSDSLYINNLSTSQPLNLKLTVVDFKPQDETGTPQLLQASDSPVTPWSLKPYITLPQSVTIAPGKSKLVPFTIKIPASLGAGSYYSAVEYLAQNGNTPERVNVAASSATLLFATVPGQAKEQLSMEQFGATQTDKAGKISFKSVFGKPPSSFSYRIKNSGNISESPSGSIVIKNFFGKVVANIDSANPRSELVLIGQTRRFDVCYPKSTDSQNLGKNDNCKSLNLKPGRYTAEIQMLYGLNGQNSSQIGAKATFWYLPLWFVFALFIVLALISYGIYRLYRKLSAPRHRHKHKK